MDGAVEGRDCPADGSRCLWVGVVPVLKYLSPASSGQDVRLMVGSVRAFGLALSCPSCPRSHQFGFIYPCAEGAKNLCAPLGALRFLSVLSARTVGWFSRARI